MLKRTKGRLLLTLLVVTGLAGTLNNSSLSQKERKFAATILKESKNRLSDHIKGLSNNQLNYKLGSDQKSIKKYIVQIAWNEKKLWENIASIMKQPADPEKRAAINVTDDQLIQMTERGDFSSYGAAIFKQANIPWRTVNEAMVNFKSLRTEHMRYIKTSTEDLRNHVIYTPAGWIDCYQYILMMAAQSDRYIRQIDQIKAYRNFPKH
jgi:hypothetical protein